MNVQAGGPPDGRRGLPDLCWRLDLRGQSSAEAAWMAALYRVIVDGGELAIRPSGEPEVVVEFDAIFGKG